MQHPLIEKLADKTLSFGCILYDEEKYREDVYIGKASELDLGINKLDVHPVGLNGPITTFKVLGHPIYIGDVLEKMCKLDNHILFEADDTAKVDDAKKKLLALWLCHFGGNKSLQEIEAESGYEKWCLVCEEEYIGIKCHIGSQGQPQLEDPNARQLFEFIESLNL